MSVSSRVRRRIAFTVVHRIFIVAVLLYFLAPFVWMVLYSVLPAKDLQQENPVVDLGHLTFSTYARVLSDPLFRLAFGDSALVAGFTTVICIILGSFAAYGIARFRFRGRQTLLLSMLATQAIPVIILAVPLFIIIRSLGLYDTQAGLIVTYCAFVLPLVVWMMVGFFEDVPPSLERAARIDGCSRLQTYFRIILPLALSGVVAAAILAFITAWSDFFLAKILTASNAVTLPVRTAAFQGLFAADYTAAATAGVITALPVLVITLVAQRWIVRGLTEGAVKG